MSTRNARGTGESRRSAVDGSRRARRRVVGALALVTLLAAAPAVAAGSGPAAPGPAAGRPANDAFRDARRVTLRALVEMDTAGATVQAGEPPPGCEPRGRASVWFTFTPADDGLYAADTMLSGFDTIVAVYTGDQLAGLHQIACSDDAGGPASDAIFPARAGVTYRIAITGFRGATGPLDLYLDFAPDLTPPVVRAPVSALALGATLGTSTLTRWSATDPQSGVRRYEVQLSEGGGPFRSIALPQPDSRHSRHLIRFDVVARFRVRATNHAGMVSGWRTGPAFVPRLVEDGAPSLHTTGTWQTQRSAAASGGSTTWSSQAGATLSTTVRTRTIAIVAPTGPGRGEVRVRLDGAVAATVDLGSTTGAPRKVVFVRSFRAFEQHTLTLEVVGTVGRPRVDLDAIDIHVAPGA